MRWWVPCMVWLREIERAFRSFKLKLSKSLCSKCLFWTTRSPQAKVWQERTVEWQEEGWKEDKWKKKFWNLTKDLESVLSLSRRFLRVFLKPRNFGFSSFAAGLKFFWTWTIPLFVIKDGQQCRKNMKHMNEIMWGDWNSVVFFTLLYFLLLILQRSVSFTKERTQFSSSITNFSILLAGISVQDSYQCAAAFFFVDLSLFFHLLLLLLLTFTVVDETELKIHLCLQAGGYTNRNIWFSPHYFICGGAPHNQHYPPQINIHQTVSSETVYTHV